MAIPQMELVRTQAELLERGINLSKIDVSALDTLSSARDLRDSARLLRQQQIRPAQIDTEETWFELLCPCMIVQEEYEDG